MSTPTKSQYASDESALFYSVHRGAEANGHQSQALNLVVLEPGQHPRLLPCSPHTSVSEQGQAGLQV